MITWTCLGTIVTYMYRFEYQDSFDCLHFGIGCWSVISPSSFTSLFFTYVQDICGRIVSTVNAYLRHLFGHPQITPDACFTVFCFA